MRISTAVTIALTLALIVLGFMKYNAAVNSSPDARAIVAATQMNPFIQSDNEVIGEWAKKGENLVLFPDYTFTYIIDGKPNKGTWSRRDYDLFLDIDGYTTAMRFVKNDRQKFLLIPSLDFRQFDGDEYMATAILSAFQKI